MAGAGGFFNVRSYPRHLRTLGCSYHPLSSVLARSAQKCVKSSEGSGAHQAQRGPARTGGGPIRPTSLRRPASLVQDTPGASASRGIRLGDRYTSLRLDAACRRALDVDLIDVNRVERILVQALEQEAMPQLPLPMPAGRFARPCSVFALVAGGRS